MHKSSGHEVAYFASVAEISHFLSSATRIAEPIGREMGGEGSFALANGLSPMTTVGIHSFARTERPDQVL